MTGPIRGDEIVITVPQREQLYAVVEDVAPRHLELRLLTSPRTSFKKLEAATVYVQFVDASGVCRYVGKLRQNVAGLRIVGYGAGEIIRFEHRGHAQLLRRPELISMRVHAAVALAPSCPSLDDEPQTVRTQTSEITGTGFSVRGLADHPIGERLRFELTLPDEVAPLRGEVEVSAVSEDGVATLAFTELGQRERGRLIRYAQERGAVTQVA